MNDLERAIEIALDAHEGDTDKAGTTYIRHPLRLMERMDTEEERIVAVLHDVVEDSQYEPADIEAEFGAGIREAVDTLTKRPDDSYLEDYIPRIAENDLASAVKQEDLKDNMDITRLPEVDDGTVEQVQKYHSALQQLSD